MMFPTAVRLGHSTGNRPPKTLQSCRHRSSSQKQFISVQPVMAIAGRSDIIRINRISVLRDVIIIGKRRRKRRRRHRIPKRRSGRRVRRESRRSGSWLRGNVFSSADPFVVGVVCVVVTTVADESAHFRGWRVDVIVY